LSLPRHSPGAHAAQVQDGEQEDAQAARAAQADDLVHELVGRGDGGVWGDLDRAHVVLRPAHDQLDVGGPNLLDLVEELLVVEAARLGVALADEEAQRDAAPEVLAALGGGGQVGGGALALGLCGAWAADGGGALGGLLGGGLLALAGQEQQQGQGPRSQAAKDVGGRAGRGAAHRFAIVGRGCYDGPRPSLGACRVARAQSPYRRDRMLSRAPLALVGLALCFAACSSETVNVGEENNADNNAQNNTGANNAQANNAQANNAQANNGDNSATNNSAANNADNNATNNSAQNNADNNTNNAQNNSGEPDANSDGPLCGEQLAFYADEDGDSYGDEGVQECGDAAPEGFAARAGDCALGDASVNPGADEICNDNVDDDCQGGDAVCPTTQGNGVDVPAWDCEDESPPANVYAWAKFEQDQPYFQAGGCFVFFEGLAGEFYVKHNLQRANTSPDCAGINGCTCPSLNGWPSYDRRLYAFTPRHGLGELRGGRDHRPRRRGPARLQRLPQVPLSIALLRHPLFLHRHGRGRVGAALVGL
jgi:hypothetical protein